MSRGTFEVVNARLMGDQFDNNLNTQDSYAIWVRLTSPTSVGRVAYRMRYLLLWPHTVPGLIHGGKLTRSGGQHSFRHQATKTEPNSHTDSTRGVQEDIELVAA